MLLAVVPVAFVVLLLVVLLVRVMKLCAAQLEPIVVAVAAVGVAVGGRLWWPSVVVAVAGCCRRGGRRLPLCGRRRLWGAHVKRAREEGSAGQVVGVVVVVAAVLGRGSYLPSAGGIDAPLGPELANDLDPLLVLLLVVVELLPQALDL